MRRTRRVLSVLLAAGTAGALTAGPAVAGDNPAGAPGRLQVLAGQLSSPKGLTAAPSGDPVVGQGAFGPPGPVLEYVLRGPQSGGTVALTEPLALADVAAARDGSGWALGAGSPQPGVPGDPWLYRRTPDGVVRKVVDIAAYQKTDPDPADKEANPTESNPYGVATTRNGDALVVDAANNDLLRVTPAGRVTTVARFGLESVATDHLPAAQRPPVATVPAEAVPTTVTIGPDGYAYVGELKGFPFRPGSSRIWRVDPSAHGAQCTVGASRGGCRPYASGFTAIQDIAFAAGRTLYVYELARGGVQAFEAGLAPGGTSPAAVLLRVRHGVRTELVAGQLSQPGGVWTSRGRAFVTDQVFGAGRGRLLEVRR